MPIYLPCLNVDQPDDGSGFSVGIGGAPTAGEGGVSGAQVGISITHSDSPIALTISPFPPFIFLGPNFAFWSNLFGLGETRIEREKQQIQEVLTSIFKYLKMGYGVPVRDGHALQFSSDGVQEQFRRRPDIKALVPSLMDTSEFMASQVFADKTPSSGQEERTVNQFLANAAINDWPVVATRMIWDGMLDAARPGCASDGSRWLRNPVLIEQTAYMAVLLQYIPLNILVAAGLRGALLHPLATSVVLHWEQNPSLVANIPSRNSYAWQELYRNGQWQFPPWSSPLTGLVPFPERDHLRPLYQGTTFQRPRYPDFLAPGQGGLPVPQPQPTPTIPPPTPQPPPIPPTQFEIVPPAQHDLPPQKQDIDFACWVWSQIYGGHQFTTRIQFWIDSPLGQAAMHSQQLNPLCFTAGNQPGPDYNPQPDPPPPQGPPPVLEIPNQADIDRACQIYKRIRSNALMTTAEMTWINSPIGKAAWLIVKDRPECQPTQQQPNPQPNDPNCPPWQGPGPRPQPWPGPQPQPGPQPRDNNCDPDCQDQIDDLKAQHQDLFDHVWLGIEPRLTNIEHWLVDLERRVPGARDPLPQPIPNPPNFPGTPDDPGDDIDGDGIPDDQDPTPPVPTFPPEVIDCLIELCDPDKFKDKVKALDRELECLSIGLCDEAGGPWGSMADCWLGKHTPEPTDILGVLRGRVYPDAPALEITSVWKTGGQSRYQRPAEQGASMVLAAWQGTPIQVIPDSEAHIQTRGWIFAPPQGAQGQQIKLRSVKPRDGEIDPCTGVAQGTLELP